MSIFDSRYSNDETGCKAINPKLLIKIVLFGYSQGMISSRSLEQTCQKIMTFMALACGWTPDHSTIAAFVSSIDYEINANAMVDDKRQIVTHAQVFGSGQFEYAADA